MTQSDFLNLFVRPPGELLYFFTVIAITLASLFMALGQRMRRPNDLAARRYSIAMFGALVAWIALMIGALLALLTDREAVGVLPPLERFATVTTILMLTWAFITSNRPPRRLPRLLLIVGVLLTMVGYIYTAIEWSQIAQQADFNLSVYGTTWAFAAAVLSLVSILLIVTSIHDVVDAPLKLVFYGILLLGYSGTLLQIAQGNIIGDYSGPVRLAFIAALVIVAALIYRSIVQRLEGEISHTVHLLDEARAAPPRLTEPTAPPVRTVSPVERESVQLLRALGMILENAETATNVPQQIIHAVIEVLRVDLAVLLRLQDANYADVEVAYDSMMKRSINGIAINLDNQPTLTSAIERLEQRVILPDQNRDELEDLYTRLDIEQMGPAYFQPIKREGSLLGVLIVALPYTNRELSGPERELLKGVTVIAGGLLMLSDAAADASLLAEERAIQALVQGIAPGQVEAGEAVSAREELQNSLQLAREQIKQLSSQVLQLKVQLDEERGRIAADLGDTEDGLSISQQMVALVDEQQSLRQEREQLMQRLQEAETALQGVMTADDALMYRDMIEALQQERVELIGERERLQEELDTLRGGPLETPQDAQKLLERMNQERSELEQERDQYNAKLADLESQLEAFGLQAGTAGLTQLIFQLNEQRAMLQNQNAQLQSERDRLLQERSELADRIYHEEERKSQIEALQTQLQNIAGDREAVTRQRDQLRTAYSELERKVDDIKEHRTRLLAQASAYQMELQEAHQEQIALRQRIQELSNTRSDWASERDRLTAEKQAIENERDQLMARIEGDRQRLQELGTNGVGSLTSMIDDLTRQRSAMEHQLTEAQNKIAYLENELEAMEVLAEGVAPRYQPENPELMMSLVQDLRTPMTSIVGYVDLLMSESAGILGEMQRKFLRRVATNVTRLTMLLDDLVRVTELDTGQFALEYGSVDVVDLITDAIENASVQFREKGLTINLNLPDAVPDISGDQDAVEQIIGQLLTNAYLVSPPGSAITISAYRQEMVLTLPDDDEAAVDCVYISVEDRGGGIASEDQERVFARKYKADNPLIQGLGDTGVGLSVAKALVEAHGGRLWLETDENVGSIFSFVLPIKAIRVLEEMPDAS